MWSSTLTGLAAAYAAQDALERARELLSQALQWLPNARLPVHVTPVAWLAELLYAIAVAQVRTLQTNDALDMLEQALGAGWRDANWLERGPEMRPLLHEPRFVGFIEQVRKSPTVELAIHPPARPRRQA
jgi:tetratricopeptide (TPR) repeat protein